MAPSIYQRFLPMLQHRTAAKSALLLLGSLGLELLLLRFALREWLNIRIGWSGLTDFELALPGAVGAFLFLSLFFYVHRDPPRISAPRYPLKSRAPVILGFLSYSWLFRNDLAVGGTPRIIWFVLLVSLVTTHISLHLPLRSLLRKPVRRLLVPLVLCIASSGLSQNFPETWWPDFLSWWGPLACGASQYSNQILSCGIVSDSLASVSRFALRIVTQFNAFDIGKGCAGFEGCALFLAVFSSWILLAGRELSYLTLFSIGIFGVIWIALANLIRLFLLIQLVDFLHQWISPSVASWLGLGLIHANLGWVCYFALILFYFWCTEAALVWVGGSRRKTHFFPSPVATAVN
jgi:exosortase/archaeosortase family protein